MVSAPILHVGADVSGRRVFDRDACGHQLAVFLLPHDSTRLRQFRAAVDSADFVGVVHNERLNIPSILPVDGDQIRQVVFALGILGRNLANRLSPSKDISSRLPTRGVLRGCRCAGSQAPV